MSTKKDLERDLKEARYHIRCLLILNKKESATAENARLFLNKKPTRPLYQLISKGRSLFSSKSVQ